MKTASRHQQTGATRPPFKRKSEAREPDRIIMPLRDDEPAASARSYAGGFNAFEYADFEEISGSDAFDQVIFQEYAHEDPTRLRRK